MDVTSRPLTSDLGPLPDAPKNPGNRPRHRPARYEIRRMGLHDLPFVTELHRTEFQEGFFVRLGARFLRRYYRTFLDGPLATAIVCEDDGRVCGYLVGVLDPPQHRRLLVRHHGASLAFSATVSFIWRPRLALHFLRTRARRYFRSLVGHARGSTGTAESTRVAVLTYVAVDPSRRGHGIGTTLVERFLVEAAAANRSVASLVTLAGAGAGRFYASRGWVHVSDARRPDGQSLELYQFQLDPGV